MRKNKTYTKAFKQECVQYMHNNLSMTFAEAAENLGIPASTLQRWYKNAMVEVENPKTGTTTTISAEQLELQQLRKENRRLKMEAEILKKAAAFFAKDQW